MKTVLTKARATRSHETSGLKECFCNNRNGISPFLSSSPYKQIPPGSVSVVWMCLWKLSENNKQGLHCPPWWRHKHTHTHTHTHTYTHSHIHTITHTHIRIHIKNVKNLLSTWVLSGHCEYLSPKKQYTTYIANKKKIDWKSFLLPLVSKHPTGTRTSLEPIMPNLPSTLYVIIIIKVINIVISIKLPSSSKNLANKCQIMITNMITIIKSSSSSTHLSQ